MTIFYFSVGNLLSLQKISSPYRCRPSVFTVDEERVHCTVVSFFSCSQPRDMRYEKDALGVMQDTKTVSVLSKQKAIKSSWFHYCFSRHEWRWLLLFSLVLSSLSIFVYTEEWIETKRQIERFRTVDMFVNRESEPETVYLHPSVGNFLFVKQCRCILICSSSWILFFPEKCSERISSNLSRLIDLNIFETRVCWQNNSFICIIVINWVFHGSDS